jgi:hypothetical protein
MNARLRRAFMSLIVLMVSAPPKVAQWTLQPALSLSRMNL